MRARVFVDFWNFTLGWNDATGKSAKCDWSRLPTALVSKAAELLATTGETAALILDETIVHASVEDAREAKLRVWLTSWLAQQPSFDVKIRARKPRRHPVHCRSCGNRMTVCTKCQEPLTISAEKGVDAALVTDLLSLAWQRAYDVAVLVSGDADYIPAVEYVQSQGLKVVNAAWASKGHELRRECWGSFTLDDLIPDLTR
ncbi:MAG TPA: NYN domain-containing protein [Streptosporangiaceae bacterium]|nr:NYN domain-containing protein [Streptosporangiaceae bacterium]